MARVYIPTSLRTLTGGKAHVQVDAADVGRLLDDLEGRLGEVRCDADARILITRACVSDRSAELLRGWLK